MTWFCALDSISHAVDDLVRAAVDTVSDSPSQLLPVGRSSRTGFLGVAIVVLSVLIPSTSPVRELQFGRENSGVDEPDVSEAASTETKSEFDAFFRDARDSTWDDVVAFGENNGFDANELLARAADNIVRNKGKIVPSNSWIPLEDEA